jgi:Signal transduction histidine kinase
VAGVQTNTAEIKDLTQQLDSESFAVLNKRRKELANQLHGEVQSRLMSLVLRQEAGQTIDRVVAIEELSQISKLLEQGTPEVSSLEQSVQKTVNKWQGFAKITVTQLETNKDPVVVAEIIDEAVSNAFRHGKANKVTVSLKDNQLTVIDNGIGPTKGKPGIGSQLLDSASREWELTPGVDGGSLLRVKF